jgi:Flp pilus assembly protein TadD
VVSRNNFTHITISAHKTGSSLGVIGTRYALYNLGRFEDAVYSCTRALALNGNDASAWYIKGVCLDELGRTVEATETYGKSLELEIIFDMQADLKRDDRS